MRARRDWPKSLLSDFGVYDPSALRASAQIADAICRTGTLIFIHDTAKQKEAPMVPLFA